MKELTKNINMKRTILLPILALLMMSCGAQTTQQLLDELEQDVDSLNERIVSLETQLSSLLTLEFIDSSTFTLDTFMLTLDGQTSKVTFNKEGGEISAIIDEGMKRVELYNVNDFYRIVVMDGPRQWMWFDKDLISGDQNYNIRND